MKGLIVAHYPLFVVQPNGKQPRLKAHVALKQLLTDGVEALHAARNLLLPQQHFAFAGLLPVHLPPSQHKPRSNTAQRPPNRPPPASFGYRGN